MTKILIPLSEQPPEGYELGSFISSDKDNNAQAVFVPPSDERAYYAKMKMSDMWTECPLSKGDDIKTVVGDGLTWDWDIKVKKVTGVKRDKGVWCWEVEV